MEFLKKKSGITLIALIVTIIVLLILAGISMSMIAGNNGITNQATEARDQTIIAQEREQVELAYMSALTNNLGDSVTANDLQGELDISVGNNKTQVTSGSGSILNVHFFDTRHNYEVQDGEVVFTSEGEATVEPTSIYAKLYTYSDGSGDVLVLASYDGYEESASNLSLKEDYGDVSMNKYSLSYPPEWTDAENNIIAVKIVDKIVPTTTSYYFYYCNIENINLENLDTSQVTDMSGMFSYCSSLTNLDLSSFSTSQVTDMSSMFSGCDLLIDLNLSSFDTRQVTDMSFMFAYSDSLTNLNLSSFNTSQVTDMSSMFAGCNSLTNLNLSSFNTSQVTNMSDMFLHCSLLTEIPEGLLENSQRVTSFYRTFAGCENLTGEAPELWKRVTEDTIDYIGIPDGAGCFSYCSKLINYQDIPEYWRNDPTPVPD